MNKCRRRKARARRLDARKVTFDFEAENFCAIFSDGRVIKLPTTGVLDLDKYFR